MTAPTRLFLDANVLIAAAGSPSGGSALVIELCKRGMARAVCSHLVLLEAERNVRNKMTEESLLRFYQAIGSTDCDLVDEPNDREIEAASEVIDPKDAHVLAAAIKGRVDVLLTLDRRHFMSPSVLDAGLPFSIMTPADFLRSIVGQSGRSL